MHYKLFTQCRRRQERQGTEGCHSTHVPWLILKHSVHNAQNEPITGVLLLLQHRLVQALCFLHINMHDELITYFRQLNCQEKKTDIGDRGKTTSVLGGNTSHELEVKRPEYSYLKNEVILTNTTRCCFVKEARNKRTRTVMSSLIPGASKKADQIKLCITGSKQECKPMRHQ